MPPYVIFGLPRSRTFWLSRFLSYGAWHCGHDEIRHARSLEDIKSWLAQPCTGTVETAAAPFWRLLPEGVRVVTVRRPAAEVAESLDALNLGFDRATMRRALERMNRKLDQIEARAPSVRSVPYDSLAKEEGCAAVFEHCLPYKHDPRWHELMAPLNLQTDLRVTLRHWAAFRPQSEKLSAVAKHRIIADMAPSLSETAGLTIQQERFTDWYRDAVPLFREHMAVTGQAIGDYEQKNIPVLQAIDDLGFMQITTARSNGRMFGYLMAVTSPSLDARNQLDAMHLPFFASAEFPGLGMKLQRASVDALRKRGVGMLYMRAGVPACGAPARGWERRSSDLERCQTANSINLI